MEQKKTFRKYHGSNLSTIENIHEKSLVPAHTLLSAEQASEYWKWTRSCIKKIPYVPKVSQVSYDDYMVRKALWLAPI